jgi:hypothetical protein
MLARIYKPAKTAMQSARAKTKERMLEYVFRIRIFSQPLRILRGRAHPQAQTQIKIAPMATNAALKPLRHSSGASLNLDWLRG